MSKRRDPATLAEAQQVLALSVPAAARLAGVSESQMYQSCARGETASTRRYGRVLVLAVPFLEAFGASSAVADVVAEGAPACKCARGSK